DRARVSLAVPERLALVIPAAVVHALAQRRVAERGDGVDRGLDGGGVGAHLGHHAAPACARAAVVHELHEAEADTGHAVDQVLGHPLGDVDLPLCAGAAAADADLEVEVVAQEQVDVGAADLAGPVPDAV